MKNFFMRILSLSVCILSLFTASAGAENINQEKNNTPNLTVFLNNDGKAVGEVFYKLYYVAKRSSGKFTLSEPFANMRVELDGTDNTRLNKAAEAVRSYALIKNIEPYTLKQTDGTGKVSFDGLKPGLYLVAGDNYFINEDMFTIAPFLAEVPAKGAKELKVLSKTEYSSDTSGILRVYAVWLDDNDLTDRPGYVEVMLLRDGVIFDTVILSEENSWTYTWKKLDGAHEWHIYEDVPEGYTAVLGRDGITFEIINSARKAAQPTTEPTSEKQKTPEKEKLPYTGQLWWPVYTLTAAGLLFLLFGLLCRRGAPDE